MGQLGLHRGWHALRKAQGRAFGGELLQPAARGVAFRNDFARVFVAQAGQGKGAAPGQAHALGQPLGLVQIGQALAAAQVGLGIGLQGQPALGHRPVQPGGGEHVLQGLAGAAVHQHIAGGHDGQAGGGGHLLHHIAPFVVKGAVAQAQGQRGALQADPGLQPQGLAEQHVEVGRAFGAGLRHQQHDAIGQARQKGGTGNAPFQVGRMSQVLALGCTTAADGDPLREVAVAPPRHGQRHQARMGHPGHTRSRHAGRRRGGRQAELKFSTDDERHGQTLGFFMGPHHARERTFVGDGQRAVAQRMRALHQLLGVGCPGEEAEVAAAMQLGVGGKHEGLVKNTAKACGPFSAQAPLRAQPQARAERRRGRPAADSATCLRRVPTTGPAAARAHAKARAARRP